MVFPENTATYICMRLKARWFFLYRLLQGGRCMTPGAAVPEQKSSCEARRVIATQLLRSLRGAHRSTFARSSHARAGAAKAWRLLSRGWASPTSLARGSNKLEPGPDRPGESTSSAKSNSTVNDLQIKARVNQQLHIDAIPYLWVPCSSLRRLSVSV